jgi:hypothetical protein
MGRRVLATIVEENPPLRLRLKAAWFLATHAASVPQDESDGCPNKCYGENL